MSNIVFGPVPSRRLGRSLGVNNIPPPKTCSYSCVYCQLGKTENLSITRRFTYNPKTIIESIGECLEKFPSKIDYITFVPDGEPTLDLSLGEEVKLIKEITNIPVAILTNSSLLFKEEVRNDLYRFDLVSFKIDAISEELWRKINRPHSSLTFEEVLKGVEKFRKEFSGKIFSETMIVKDVNTNEVELKKISEWLMRICPDKAYISIPIRPPAETWVVPPSEEQIVNAWNIFVENLGKDNVKLIIEYEGMDFELARDPVEDILSITSIHPMKLEYALHALSKRVPDPRKVIADLLNSRKLKLINYRGTSFLLRRIREDRDQE
ncbi:MAG: radical SAM protein [Nitrososphaerota archaeon]